MIDFIKCEILNINIEYLLNIEELEFSSRFNHRTNEIGKERLYARYKDYLITIVYERRVFIQGSIAISKNGNNHENLSHASFCEAVNELEELLNVKSNQIKLQNFEYGFSVDIRNLYPTDFIIENIIDYKGYLADVDSYAKNGYGIQYRRDHYHFKIYDKTSQYNLDNNILRIEVRVKKMVHVKKYNINYLKDLQNKNSWYRLKCNLLDKVEQLIICNLDKIDAFNFPKLDYLQLKTWENPEYWRNNRPNPKNYSLGSKDSYYKHLRKRYIEIKQEFIELINKHNLDYVKKDIIEQINIEYRKCVPQLPLIEIYQSGLSDSYKLSSGIRSLDKNF